MAEGVDPTLSERTDLDAERVRKEYARRSTDRRLHRYYKRVDAALGRQHAHRRARIVEALDSLGPRPSQRVLDVGCGRGSDLADLIREGFAPENLVGLDLLNGDLATARMQTPGVSFVLGNAADLPFPDDAFDAAMLITVLSSIVDDEVRAQVAREVVRVVRPNGCILSYDFRIVGDKNPHVVAIDETELARLFGTTGTTTYERHALSLSIASRVPPWLADLLSNVQPLLRFILAVTRTTAGDDRVDRLAESGRAVELDRIRKAYAGYADSGYDARWSGREPGMSIVAAERDQWLVEALRPLGSAVVVDLGCGDGNVATTLDRAGIRPSRYLGVDLMPARIAQASAEVPWGEFHVAPADEVPLPDRAADAIVAMTLLSSVLDLSLRELIAGEIRRILRPGGHLLVYDLRIPSPRNSTLRPVLPRELANLFPGWPMVWRSLTLLPPIARTRLAGGPLRYRLLRAVPLMRSHIAAVLTKPG